VNWWLASGWLVICVLLGVGIYCQQWHRLHDYYDWVKFCDHLHQAIGFTLQPLPQAVAAYLPVSHGGCQNILNNYLLLLKQRVDLTRERCATLTTDTMLAEFLYQLGRTGRETEQNKIVAARTIFNEKAQQAKHDLQTKASIMLKLLIIIGIAGGILWI